MYVIIYLGYIQGLALQGYTVGIRLTLLLLLIKLSPSCVQLFAIPWSEACQAALSLPPGFTHSLRKCVHITPSAERTPHGQIGDLSSMKPRVSVIRPQYGPQSSSLSSVSLAPPLGPREAFLRPVVHRTFIEHLLSTRPWEYNGEQPAQ